MWLISLALVSQVMGWLFIATALPRLPAVETSVLLLVQPAVFAIAWGVMFFAERMSFVQWMGSAIVLAGASRDVVAVRRCAGGCAGCMARSRQLIRVEPSGSAKARARSQSPWFSVARASRRSPPPRASPLSTAPFIYPCHLMLVCSAG